MILIGVWIVFVYLLIKYSRVQEVIVFDRDEVLVNVVILYMGRVYDLKGF